MWGVQRLGVCLGLCVGLSLLGCSAITFERGATRGEAGGGAAPSTPPARVGSDTQATVPADAATPGAQRATVVPTAVPTLAVVEPEDPNAQVRVASWWKLGGTPASLDADIEACVTKLGVAHRPEAGATRVTTALRACLRERGWRGLEPPAEP